MISKGRHGHPNGILSGCTSTLTEVFVDRIAPSAAHVLVHMRPNIKEIGIAFLDGQS